MCGFQLLSVAVLLTVVRTVTALPAVSADPSLRTATLQQNKAELYAALTSDALVPLPTSSRAVRDVSDVTVTQTQETESSGDLHGGDVVTDVTGTEAAGHSSDVITDVAVTDDGRSRGASDIVRGDDVTLMTVDGLYNSSTLSSEDVQSSSVPHDRATHVSEDIPATSDRSSSVPSNDSTSALVVTQNSELETAVDRNTTQAVRAEEVEHAT